VNSIEEFTGGERGMAFLKQEARAVERFRIIEVAEAESVTAAARRFGCSWTTVYKLIARYREGGLRALCPRRRGKRGRSGRRAVQKFIRAPEGPQSGLTGGRHAHLPPENGRSIV